MIHSHSVANKIKLLYFRSTFRIHCGIFDYFAQIKLVPLYERSIWDSQIKLSQPSDRCSAISDMSESGHLSSLSVKPTATYLGRGVPIHAVEESS